MFKNFDLAPLRRDPQVAYYFRYPLRHSDFQEVRRDGRLLGYAAAKPLYGRLTPEGKVDRTAGFDGQVAVIFLRSPARNGRRPTLLLAAMAPGDVTRADGKRNWPAIRATAEQAVLAHLRPAA